MKNARLVLGASNLRLLLRSRLAHRLGPGPLRIEDGLGRAYVVGGGFACFRHAPLLSVPDPPDLGRAILLDLGADLLFGVPPETFTDRILARVSSWRATGVAVTIATIFERPLARMSPTRYLLIRSLLYPASRTTLDAMREGVAHANGRLRAAASEDAGIFLVENLDRHPGPDGLHYVRPSAAAEAIARACS